MYKIKYSNTAVKSLKKIPKKHQNKILKVVDNLKEDPKQGKKLKGEFSGIFVVRVWPYRIFYLVQKREIIISIIDIR